jgi:glycosyltransferase involved in cell wall biosynthesis
MKFSVLVPTLNEEKYVGTLLKALTQQTHKDFEVIVVDGNSEDKTKEVVERFKKKLDIKFFISKKRGPSIQRNLAAKQAKNKDLVFFDADVKPEKRFLEKLARIIDSKKIDAASSWNIPMGDRILDHFLFAIVNVFVLQLFSKVIPTGVGTFIYMKRSVFRDIGGFDEEVVFGEDFELLKRLGEKRRYKFIILRDPKIHFSVRRLEKEGRCGSFIKFTRAAVYYLVKGPIKDPDLFVHEFGKY